MIHHYSPLFLETMLLKKAKLVPQDTQHTEHWHRGVVKESGCVCHQVPCEEIMQLTLLTGLQSGILRENLGVGIGAQGA